MLVILYVGLATYLSCSYADEIFPEALVFEELGLSDIINNSKSDENRNNTIIIAGDLNDALTTMNFHRKNINDYLCRQYVVEEILKDITDSASSESRSMSQDSRGTSKTSIMQTDQGSSAYNAWLIKTKLLKKIYDEYDLNVRMHEKPVGFTLTNTNNESLGTHDYETMKNVDDEKDLKKPYHSNEDSFSSPSDTVSVDFTQSQSIQYDIDNDNEYKKSNQPYQGLHNFNPTQSTHLPPSAYEPSFPPTTSHGPPLLPTYYGPPPFLNETPSYPSDYGMPPLSSYGPPSTPHESYSSPTSYGSSAPINGHSFLPPLNNRSPYYPHPGLIPPTENPGPDLTTRNIKTINQLEDEDHTPDREPKQGLTATDMYDLTLTAIAFLGFGTFVMHLVMDAMMAQSGATLTINSSPLHGATVSRVKRHDNSVYGEINELSWTIVSTIDNMMANVDGTFVNCKEVKALCRRSKKLVKTGTNFSSKLLPVWNVALGWLSNKLGTDKSQPVISALLGHCILPSQCQKNA
ncbi:uncharacterized protein LOC132920317 [Rhopalosiphum padi]|uniref:uncharacterized protein LOC132920317 n=1 Tax=Rhopalosiphum padi TaxID=40932 RepID=UPI00298DE1A0|nr:uncharacterized protein LOC132920317 [Rhopalosiphum padi]